MTRILAILVLLLSAAPAVAAEPSRADYCTSPRIIVPGGDCPGDPPATSSPAHTQRAKQPTIDDMLNANENLEFCGNVKNPAPGVERSINCRKKGMALYSKVEVVARRDAIYWLKVTVYDNGWLPLVELCRRIGGMTGDVCTGNAVNEAELLEAQRALERLK